MLIRRGLQIARRGYRERGLGGLISDLGSLVKSIWFASLNRPISSHGVSIHGTRQLGILQTAEIIAGRYEQAEAEFSKEYISDETSVVEFGGGIGYVTALINQTHKIDQHIVLEMNPEIIPVFRDNMSKNDVNICLDTSAYSAQRDSVSIDTGETFRDTTTCAANSGEINSKSLSNLINEYELDEFALVVDIEATENELLEQEFEVMNSHCPLVIIEFHPSRLDRHLRHYLEKMQSNYILSDRRGDVFVFQRLEE